MLDENRTTLPLPINSVYLHEGIVFEDENIRVTAVKSNHLPANADNTPASYSFLVETENKRIVISGDVKEPHDLDGIIGDCDYFFMETGHHKVEDVCLYAKQKSVGKLYLYHHGREIIDDLKGSFIRARDIFANTAFCSDGLTIRL